VGVRFVEEFTDGNFTDVFNPYGFIYVITNLVNGKRYIGQKKFDNCGRWVKYMGGGKHLKVAQEKYGLNNFKRDIVYLCYSSDELNQAEYDFVKYFNAVESDSYYNMIDGGNVGVLLCESRKIDENKIKVMSIYDRKIFKDLYDAKNYYSIQISYIKNSFEYNGKFGNNSTSKRKLPIFRDLSMLKKHQTFCCVCGCIFTKNTNKVKLCSFCKPYYYGSKKKQNEYDKMVVRNKLIHTTRKSDGITVKCKSCNNDIVLNKEVSSSMYCEDCIETKNNRGSR
jgi:ribosomal protein S27E